MKKVLIALVYTALALGANTAVAADIPTLEALRDGDMKKLSFHSEPKPIAVAAFTLEDGGEGTLADYEGKYILLNFWATWCAPCRKEMPQLSALQAEFGGDDFEVVTLATGRNSPTGIVKFFEEAGVDNLPRHQDPRQQVAREMAVLGLPITVLIDPQGQEIARLQGDADWHSDSARAILAELLDSPGD
ncbi:TlpA family protein disulfide reductase [Marinibacterium profundimaris]|uniref:Thioredoxin n=1 Tax=Marinibacterium profundimaris TaxID=1679460 RepID=A0A225NME2_9RHOB|nr:TlpA disulfide reductase family protein [Marinibacterium profundimaris]OWU73359.1 thioredoxin [Marinibacterium profundimaris]